MLDGGRNPCFAWYLGREVEDYQRPTGSASQLGGYRKSSPRKTCSIDWQLRSFGGSYLPHEGEAAVGWHEERSRREGAALGRRDFGRKGGSSGWAEGSGSETAAGAVARADKGNASWERTWIVYWRKRKAVPVVRGKEAAPAWNVHQPRHWYLIILYIKLNL